MITVASKMLMVIPRSSEKSDDVYDDGSAAACTVGEPSPLVMTDTLELVRYMAEREHDSNYIEFQGTVLTLESLSTYKRLVVGDMLSSVLVKSFDDDLQVSIGDNIRVSGRIRTCDEWGHHISANNIVLMAQPT